MTPKLSSAVDCQTDMTRRYIRAHLSSSAYWRTYETNTPTNLSFSLHRCADDSYYPSTSWVLVFAKRLRGDDMIFWSNIYMTHMCPRSMYESCAASLTWQKRDPYITI